MSEKLECKTLGWPLIAGKNESAKRVILFVPTCKMWSCPACAQTNSRLWKARTFHAISTLVDDYSKLYFLTLTSHESLTAEQSLWVWPKAWKKLSMRARRAKPKGLYCMIPERHTDGRLHTHSIDTFGLTTRWWKDNGRSCGLGYIDEEDEIKSAEGAAHYVGKYLVKQLLTDWPKGFRRVRTSRDWPKLPPYPTNPDWKFELAPKFTSKARITDYFGVLGYDVQWCTDAVGAWQIVNPVESGTETLP